MESKFIYFETYGCKANQNNAEIMKGLCLQSGLQLTSNPDISDILVINTCIVKGRIEKKVESRISDLKTKYRNKPIIISGCMPQARAEKLKGKNLYLLGIHHIKELPKLIRKIYENKYSEKEFLAENQEIKLCLPKIPVKKETAITQISEGCLNNCSFCIVKFAKGKLFSYPEEKIIKSIQNDLISEAKEIWLTSQDSSSYGLDKGKSQLPELLKKILNLKGNFKVKLGMMNPENVLKILPELIEIYKHKKMEKFLHIPLQSGSDEILKKMNRKYSASDFIKIIESFKKEIPDIFISTDIIVGFPSETQEDFEKTLEIINKIKPDFINISRFWNLKGTEAAKMPQLEIKTIKQRAIKLAELYKQIRKYKRN